ncbi:MAG TPA: hypothetical protein VIL84_11270 [Devosiaceae bacterium]
MCILRIGRVLAFVPLMALAACATPPSHINNVCAVFDQRDGWFDNWSQVANGVQRKYGVPVHVLMATIRQESGFKGDAKPPVKWVFGIIPWGRVSSADGFSQALDGTWKQYQRETGNFMASRGSFADAADFIGWYYAKSSQRFGIPLTDTYHLYLTYYLGPNAYERGDWRSNSAAQTYARRTADRADTYAAQLQGCS